MENKDNLIKRKAFINKPVGRALLLALIFVFAAALPVIAGSRAVYAEEARAQAAEDTAETGGVEGGAYEVTSYTLRAVVNKDHSYDVEKTIKVTIPDQLQSIEFAVPSGNFRISEVKLDGYSYSIEGGNKIVITDAEKLGIGDHEYTISYRIQEYEDGDNTRDIFYYNALLPEWKQPIGKVDIELRLPKDFPIKEMKCYAGQFGVQDSTNKIVFKNSQRDMTARVTGSLIPENYGISLKAQLPEGYWTGALSGRAAFIATIITLLSVVTILAVLWFIGGRDPKVKKQKVTKPIEGLSPVELGYVYNGNVSIKDILLLILEFAIKGYLRISEYEPKSYRIFREEDPSEEERMYRSAYSILFEDVFRDRAVEMDELIPRLHLIKRSIRDDVASGFASAESSPFTPVSRIFRYIGSAVYGIGIAAANALSYVYAHQTINFVESLLMGIFAAGTSVLLCAAIDNRDSSSRQSAGFQEVVASVIAAIPIIYVAYRIIRNTKQPVLVFALVVASGLAIFLVIIMRARGKANAELITAIRRLRHFIYHPTPKELLENHLADENYYYEMLLYALAFGAEESWAISFLTLDVKEPDWFTDDIEGEAFSNLKTNKETVDCARDIKSFIRTVENAYNDMMRKRNRIK